MASSSPVARSRTRASGAILCFGGVGRAAEVDGRRDRDQRGTGMRFGFVAR